MPSTFEIDETQVERLHGLALTRGMSETALIAEALEMLFRQIEREQAISEDMQTLRDLGVGADFDDPPSVSRDPRDYTITHSVSPVAVNQVKVGEPR